MPSRAEGHKCVHERAALGIVGTERECLFELVDGDDKPRSPVRGADRLLERGQWVQTGSQQGERPVLAPRQRTLRQGGQQSRTEHGRLAAAGRPHDAQQRRADETGDHLAHEPLAAEEELSIGDVERGEALERADDNVALVLYRLVPLARNLQLDYVVGQLGLDRTQLGATGGRASRRGTDLARCFAARPLARHLVDAARNAAARVEQPLGRHIVAGVRRRVVGSDRSDGLDVERRERPLLTRPQASQRIGVLTRRQHHHRARRQGPCQRVQISHRTTAGAVGVVQHQQGRVRRPSRPAQDRENHLRRVTARGVQQGRAPVVSLAGDLGRQARLPDSVRADERHERAGTALDLLPALAQPHKLRLSPYEPPRRGGVELARQLGNRMRQLERGVVTQDRLVQAPEIRSGLYADVRYEPAPRTRVGLERLGLATVAVQREHQLAGEMLASRVGGDERLQLAHERRVPAGREVGLHPRLQRGQPLLLEPRDLALHERLERQLREWRPAPQAQRVAQHRCGVDGVAVLQCAASIVDHVLEALDVQLARAHG